MSRDGSLTRGLQPPNGGMRLSLWLQESLSSIEQFQRDASTIEQSITKLTGILQQIESSSTVHEVTTIRRITLMRQPDVRTNFNIKNEMCCVMNICECRIYSLSE